MFENDLLATKEIDPAPQQSVEYKAQIYISNGFFENFSGYSEKAKQRVNTCYSIPDSRKEEIIGQIENLTKESIKKGQELKKEITNWTFPERFWLEQQQDAKPIIQRKDWSVVKKVQAIFMTNHLKRDGFHITHDFQNQPTKQSQMFLALIKNSKFPERNLLTGEIITNYFQSHFPYNYLKVKNFETGDFLKNQNLKINDIFKDLQKSSEEKQYFNSEYLFKVNLFQRL